MKLLKTFFLVLFFSLILNSVNAQGWGVRAGVNISSVSGNNMGEVKSQTGAYAGVYKEIKIISNLLFIQPELQYSKQGFDTEFKNYDLHYIQVPVMAKLYFLKIISIETGPQFGFLVNDNSNSLEFNKFDPVWAFGLSFNLPLHLSIGARYITSFDEVVDHTNAKNQVIQAGIGFRF